ncbi:MAG: methyltransferase domain-containing protein, partial [Paracoccaceae bacterium]
MAELGNAQPGNKVLDVACGTGTVTRLIPSYVGASGSVTGLDIDAGRLDVAASLRIALRDHLGRKQCRRFLGRRRSVNIVT